MEKTKKKKKYYCFNNINFITLINQTKYTKLQNKLFCSQDQKEQMNCFHEDGYLELELGTSIMF